jgi:hypothetical protein
MLQGNPKNPGRNHEGYPDPTASQAIQGDDMKIRPEAGGEYALDKHEFYMALHYAQCYSSWVTARSVLMSTKTVDPSSGGVRSSLPGKPTESTAIKIAELDGHIKLIEDTVREAGEDIAPWLLVGVTGEYVTYNALAQGFGARGEAITPIPCGKNYYYIRRRKFYFLLAKKMLGEVIA